MTIGHIHEQDLFQLQVSNRLRRVCNCIRLLIYIWKQTWNRYLLELLYECIFFFCPYNVYLKWIYKYICYNLKLQDILILKWGRGAIIFTRNRYSCCWFWACFDMYLYKVLFPIPDAFSISAIEYSLLL